MILKKQFYRRANNSLLKLLLTIGMVCFSVFLILFIQKSWGDAVKFLCGFYTLATGIFFIAQVYGFIVSQTHYSDSIEAPKFVMLENEELEWKH